jgi:hypothetical protein
MLLHIPQSLFNTLSWMKDFQMQSESSSSFLVPIKYKTNCILMAVTIRTFECFHNNHYMIAMPLRETRVVETLLPQRQWRLLFVTHDETIRKVVSSSNKFHWPLNRGGKIGIKPKARTQMLKSVDCNLFFYF